MEEIDIIELLKRVKEGKEPKEIEIEGTKYKFRENCPDIACIYQTEDYDDWLENEYITLDTKIKILDKPIIEELDDYNNVDIFDLARKVNQIIKHINKEEK